MSTKWTHNWYHIHNLLWSVIPLTCLFGFFKRKFLMWRNIIVLKKLYINRFHIWKYLSGYILLISGGVHLDNNFALIWIGNTLNSCFIDYIPPGIDIAHLPVLQGDTFYVTLKDDIVLSFFIKLCTEKSKARLFTKTTELCIFVVSAQQ